MGESMTKMRFVFRCILGLSVLAFPSGALAAPETTPNVIQSGNEHARAGAFQDEAGRIIIPSIPGVSKIFLPDIGISGDFAFERNNLRKADPRFDPSLQQARIRDGSVVFFSPIDPYTNAQFTIDIPEGGPANIEEAWVHFNKLPAHASVRLGRFLPQFGLLDQLNTFQLPMLNRPTAIGNYIGQDGLIVTGVNANIFIPNPWDYNLKADLNVVRGDSLLGPAQTLDLTYLATVDYSQDAFTSGSLESGVSVAEGPAPASVGGAQTLFEPYLQIQYAPSQQNVWTWRAEGMLAERQGLGSDNFKSGFYSFLDYNFALRYHAGFLVDVGDRPVAPYGKQVNLAPNFTWFLSGNMRVRAQYTHTTALASMRPEETISLQATFSLGNLKQLN
jgi:hypothetical protein